MARGNPQAAYNQLLSSNPQFAQFMRQVQGMSPQQVAQMYGLDWQQVQDMMR